MLTDLLWFLGAKQQHDMQKGQGLAGLIGLLLVIFMVWQWDSLFYPIFDKLGLVAMAGRIGLISDLPVMTVINVLAILFFIALFFSLAAVAFFVIGTLLIFMGMSNVGRNVLLTPLAILLSPIWLFIVMFQKRTGFPTPEIAYKRDRELKPLISKYKHENNNMKMFRYYQEQINRSDEKDRIEMFYGKKKIKPVLHRVVASIKEDREWLVSYDRNTEQWFILFPNPLPEFASSAFSSDQSRTNKSLYDFNGLGIARLFEKSEYVVPGLPISFEWTGNEITARIMKENPSIKKVTIEESMIAYKIKTKNMSTLFDEVAQLNRVQSAILESHLAIYLIPLANPISPLSNDTQDFLDELATIPFTDTFAPIYAADVHERMIHYAECGKEYAINWLKSSI